MSDKMKHFSEIKTTRGFRSLLKDLAVSASTGKTEHDFLGRIKVNITVSQDCLHKLPKVQNRSI